MDEILKDNYPIEAFYAIFPDMRKEDVVQLKERLIKAIKDYKNKAIKELIDSCWTTSAMRKLAQPKYANCVCFQRPSHFPGMITFGMKIGEETLTNEEFIAKRQKEQELEWKEFFAEIDEKCVCGGKPKPKSGTFRFSGKF